MNGEMMRAPFDLKRRGSEGAAAFWSAPVSGALDRERGERARVFSASASSGRSNPKLRQAQHSKTLPRGLRWFGLGAAWLLALAQPGGAPAAETLWWPHADRQLGRWLGVEDGWLIWQAELLAEPVRLWLPRLHGWDADAGAAGNQTTPQGAWRLRLGDGSFFGADDPAFGAGAWSLTNAHAGSLHVDAAAVREMMRWEATGPLLFAGPDGETEMTHENRGNKPGQRWEAVPGGMLRTRSIDQAISLPLALPERLRLDLWLRTEAKDQPPKFRLKLRRSGQGVELETWMEELVGRGDGMPARFATLHEPACAVTLCVDFKARRAWAYDMDGKEMGVWKVRGVMKKTQTRTPEKGRAAGGLFGVLAEALVPGLVRQDAAASQQKKEIENGWTLVNLGSDLTLERVLAREWDGEPPMARPMKEAFVELLDGRVIAGAVKGITAGIVQAGSEPGVKLEEVAWIHAAPRQEKKAKQAAGPDAAATVPEPGARVRCADGSFFYVEKIVSADGRTLTLEAAWAREAMTLRRAGLESLRWYVPEPLAGPLLSNHSHLDGLQPDKGPFSKGRWEPGPGAVPRWRLDGAERSAPVKIKDGWSIRLAQPETVGDNKVVELLPSMAYLASGEIIPVEVASWEAKDAVVRTPFVVEPGQNRLPAAAIRALELAGPGLQTKGFGDLGWTLLHGGAQAMTRAEDGRSVTLQAGAALGHGSFLQGTQLNFALSGDSYGALRLRLFCDGVQEKSPHLALLVFLNGNSAYCGVEHPQRPGQMTNSFSLPIEYNKPCPVMLKWNAKQVELHIKGNLAFRQNLMDKTASGTGLILEPAGMWGNETRPCTLGNLTLRAFPGARTRPSLDSDTHAWALQVPRRQADDPPRHLLLAANGDLLRGTLEALDSRALTLRSGLETLEVPRARVATVVLPRTRTAEEAKTPPPAKDADKKQPKAAPPPKDEPAGTLWLSTADGGRVRLEVTSLGPEWVEGRSAILGSCRLPVEQIIELSTAPPHSGAGPYDDWVFAPAPEPDLAGAGESAKLVGQEAPAFELGMVGGGKFALKKEAKGKVVVLDFWASWCGPCLHALPELMETMRDLPQDRVLLLGVNQGQPHDEVKTFLQTRGWELPVALDLDRKVSGQYGAEAIPHTVVIGPDGKVAWVKTGHTPTAAQELLEAVRKLLE